LVISRAEVRSDQWVIKDPVRLTYFQVGPEEYAFLRLLDGRTSPAQIRTELSREFPDVEFDDEALSRFLISGIRSNLLVPMTPGYGPLLAARQQATRQQAVVRKLFSLISHRFRGVDPNRFLQWLDRRIGGIFDTRWQRMTALFVLSAFGVLLIRSRQMSAELPTIAQLVSPMNLLSVSLLLVLIKLVHEIGHGLTCVHHGGECHELGFILVGFIPLMYCDVSDSWLQQNRFHRMQVAAAGIAVELVLAAVFGILYLASVPGFLHSLFLNGLLICSLNTILVNGNPLLRYDGYYVCCDLLRMPNLGPDSRARATALFDRVVLGMDTQPDNHPSRQRILWMTAYGFSSIVYRWMVTISILWLINETLRPLRLEGLSYLLGLSIVAGMAFGMWHFLKQRWRLVRNDTAARPRAVTGLTVFGLLSAVVLFVPFPYSVEAPFTLSPGLSSAIYVQTAGYVTPAVRHGDLVSAGAVIAELTNPEVRLALERQQGEVRTARARLVHLTGTRQTVSSSAAALPAAEKAVENAERRLQTLQKKAQRLTLVSPADGVIRQPAGRVRQPVDRSAPQQRFRQSAPLAAENQGVWLEQETLVCYVGNPQQLRAAVFVRQQDVELILTSGRATLQFDSRPGRPIDAQVTQIGRVPELLVPPELAGKKMILTADARGRPAETLFAVYAEVRPEQLEALPALFSTGYASLECPPRSLAARAARLLAHTFAFQI
ncbi:MAG: hypothetical protein KDA89_10420, partial [Planctomycetaceae bacterium]|nr:hypothetical protein [Planctomycetaceae bacterium]